MVSVCLMILGLTACGKTDPKSVDYNGYTYDQLKQVTQNTVATLVNTVSYTHLDVYKRQCPKR